MSTLDYLPDFVHEIVRPHLDHEWHKVGRCVYCGPCNQRLYEGQLPPGHPVWTPPKRKRASTVGEDMRARWDMDSRPGGSSLR
jgi:hypothetical protein